MLIYVLITVLIAIGCLFTGYCVRAALYGPVSEAEIEPEGEREER